jgi:hypothetical protein
MSDESDEDFLNRWSRRKRAAAVESQPAARLPAPAPKPAQSSSATAGREEAAKDFDLASLPPLDAITATTNVAAFLHKEVPLELSRAALRRAWTADPLIRDFVGLAENAWDFNDPNAIPGFGPLDCSPEQLKDLLAQVMGETRPVSEPDAGAQEVGPASVSVGDPQEVVREIGQEPGQASAEESPYDSPLACSSDPVDEPPLREVLTFRSLAEDIASQHNASAENPDGQAEKAETIEEMPMVRRTHGGALPR